MMKKFLIILALLFIPLTSSAHVLKTDGDIGVLMHITPDDDPVVGEPASFHMEIKDRSGKFSADKCSCTVSITRGSQTVYSAGLFDSTQGIVSDKPFFNFSFPQKDVYRVVVNGQPHNSEFQPFTVTYDVRVARDPGDPASGGGIGTGGLIFMGVGITAVVIAVVYFLTKRPINA